MRTRKNQCKKLRATGIVPTPGYVRAGASQSGVDKGNDEDGQPLLSGIEEGCDADGHRKRGSPYTQSTAARHRHDLMEFLSCPEKSHAVRYTRGTFLAASSHAEVCFNQIDHLKLRKLSRKQLERLVSSLTMVYKGAEIEDMATIMSV